MAIAVASALTAGYFIGRARADTPKSIPVFYSGYLEDANGPVNGLKSIVLRLFDAATGGTSVCADSPSATHGSQVTAGRFRFALDDSCAAAVQVHSELWAELTVEGQTLPRSRMGAVPYALNAARVSWNGVTDVDATTEWPGTLPYSRLKGAQSAGDDGTVYTLAGRYCGSTPAGPTTGGYRAVKQQCQTACGNVSGAHVCTSEELIRSTAIGVSIPADGWFATGTASPRGSTPGNGYYNDCFGFTVSDDKHSGVVWRVKDDTGKPVSFPDTYGCQSRFPILCCN
jgi:hypothetical protein